MKLILADGAVDIDVNVLVENFGFFDLFNEGLVVENDTLDMSHLPISETAIKQLISLKMTGELTIDIEGVNSTLYKFLYDTDMCLDTKDKNISTLFENGFIFNRLSLYKCCPDFYKVTVLETGIRRKIAAGGTEPFYGLIEITKDVCENTLYTPLTPECPLFTTETKIGNADYSKGDKVFCYSEPTSNIIKQILSLGNVVISGGFALQHLSSQKCIAQDIDMFVYGLNEEEATRKLQQIGDLLGGQPYLTSNAYTFVDTNLEADNVTYEEQNYCVPTMFNISCQVILRLYETPAEILHGFDIPACKVLMMMDDDAIKYYGTPSFIETMRYNAIWIDTERQSSTYALRLIKYYCKSFDVVMTGYNSGIVDKTYFKDYDTSRKEDDISQMKGLALLLWFHHRLTTNYCFWDRGSSMMNAIKRICHKYNFIKSDYMNAVTSRHNIRDFLRNAWRYDYAKKIVEMLGWRWVKSAKNIPKVKWTTRDPSSQTVIGSFHPEQEKYYHQAYNITTSNGMHDVAMATL